jgi:putative ABC transport system substrate-binding protein
VRTRRDFITLLGSGVAAWPLAARAQQQPMPVIGFLRSTSHADSAHYVTAFHKGLKETGFVEGQNIAIEYRWADNQFDRLPALVTDLLRRPVILIVGNFNSALAAKAATRTVPIVFTSGSDPVSDGLVTSLNRPGGNITGINFFGGVLGQKRLELLRQLVPGAMTIAALINPTPDTEAEKKEIEGATKKIRQQFIVLDIRTEHEIEEAFATFVRRGADALYVGAGGFMNSHRQQLVTLAARHRLPTSYAVREAVVAGGLMSYGASISDAYRQAGIYAGRILKGEKPADLPVMRSTKFEFVINLNTAKAFGLSFPPGLLAIADEVIE